MKGVCEGVRLIENISKRVNVGARLSRIVEGCPSLL